MHQNKFPFQKSEDIKEIIKLPNSEFSVLIGNDVWIGQNVIIKGGVKVGNGAVIGMGSVVTKDVEPYSVVAGNPAREIRKRFDNDTISKLLKINWWEWNPEVIDERKRFFRNTKDFIGQFWKESIE